MPPNGPVYLALALLSVVAGLAPIRQLELHINDGMKYTLPVWAEEEHLFEVQALRFLESVSPAGSADAISKETLQVRIAVIYCKLFLT